MKNFTATMNAEHRANARDARTGESLANKEAVGIYLPQTGDTMRYVSRETWEERVSVSAAHSVIVGKSTNGMRYALTIETAECDAIHAAYICKNGAQPVWYATENGYASPTYRNMKWHDRLDILAQFAEQGTVTLEITTEEGAEVDTLVINWGKRNELGRFIKKDKRGKSALLNAVAAAVKEW